MLALLEKGWQWRTGIVLITGLITVNVLKGQRNVLKCAIVVQRINYYTVHLP